MAMKAAYLTFELFKEGNLKDKDEAGNPLPGNPPHGRKGYEEWLQTYVTTFHDVEYNMSMNIQVVIYE